MPTPTPAHPDHQPPKKKLKLKSFEDCETEQPLHNENDQSDAFFDHTLFLSHQLTSNEPFKSKFIDAHIEAQLLNFEPSESLAKAIDFKTKPVTVLAPAATITNPVNYDFEMLGTDLDLDNLFESEAESNGAEITMTDLQNVIKLEAKVGTRWNQEYHQKSCEELMNSGSVKLALRTLVAGVDSQECRRRSAMPKTVEDANIEQESLLKMDMDGGTSEGTNVCAPLPEVQQPLNCHLSVNGSLASMTASTQALNKILLSSSQTNGSGARFNSLNKVLIEY